jgi:predicted transcriptional regulator
MSYRKKQPERGEQLYLDLTAYHSYYSHWNIDLMPAIEHGQGKTLSSTEARIFQMIAMEYDADKQKPCSASYGDFAEIIICTPAGAKKAIINLLERELIIRVNDRKGRTRFEYVPNVTLCHSLLKRYVRSCKVQFQYYNKPRSI